MLRLVGLFIYCQVPRLGDGHISNRNRCEFDSLTSVPSAVQEVNYMSGLTSTSSGWTDRYQGSHTKDMARWYSGSHFFIMVLHLSNFFGFYSLLILDCGQESHRFPKWNTWFQIFNRSQTLGRDGPRDGLPSLTTQNTWQNAFKPQRLLVGVDWNMTGLFFPDLLGRIIPIDSYFSGGLKPPRLSLASNVSQKSRTTNSRCAFEGQRDEWEEFCGALWWIL